MKPFICQAHCFETHSTHAIDADRADVTAYGMERNTTTNTTYFGGIGDVSISLQSPSLNITLPGNGTEWIGNRGTRGIGKYRSWIHEKQAYNSTYLEENGECLTASVSNAFKFPYI